MRKFIGTVVIVAIVLCILALVFCYLYSKNMLPDAVYKWVESNETVKALVDKLIEHHIWDTVIDNVKEDIEVITPKAE